MTPKVRAIGTRTDNAALMVDSKTLGYLDGTVLDATYGLGRFWKLLPGMPTKCVDIDPSKGVTVADFRRLPYDRDSFDTVVLDAPYKLNGTSTGKGPSASDGDYGVNGEYQSVAAKHELIFDGIDDCLRVARTFLLVKCQDQVCAGRVHWQTHLFTQHAVKENRARLVDMLHVQGYREQPPGRRQLHASRDYSTLLVFKVGKP